MSVEETKGHIWQKLMRFEDSVADDLDRLILEVQAAMPCYYHALVPGTLCVMARPEGDYCQSCKAREELKVPA